MYCPNCGGVIPDGSNYCNICGIDLSAGDKRKTKKKKSTHQSRERNILLRLLIFLLLLPVVVVAYLYIHPFFSNLYVYSSTEINASFLNEPTINSDVSEFKFTCITYNEDDYFVFDPDDGYGWKYKALEKESRKNGYMSISILGENAYLEMEYFKTGDSFTIVYHKATLKERVFMLIQYLTWYRDV